MPQREFWSERFPTEVRYVYRVDPVMPDNPTQMTIIVRDQAGKEMTFGAGMIPPGFGPWVFADAVRASMEAFEAATPEDARNAFMRTIKEWKRAQREVQSQERRRH